MFAKAIYGTAIALLCANVALGAAVATPARDSGLVPTKINIAINPSEACGQPDNTHHQKGDSCAYKAGASTSGSTVKGHCDFQNGESYLSCVPT